MVRFKLAIVLILATVLPVIGTDYDPFADDSGSLIEENQEILTSESSLEEGPIIPDIQFTNNDITMVFQIISDATGWSIFPSKEVSKARVSLWA